MLLFGVEIQLVLFDFFMFVVVQELYSEFLVSVFKEFYVDFELSVILDVKFGVLSFFISQSRVVFLELQRIFAESCCEEVFGILDYGGAFGRCGLVDFTVVGFMVFGILDREEKNKSMELKVFRDRGDQAEIVRDFCEGVKEDLC